MRLILDEISSKYWLLEVQDFERVRKLDSYQQVKKLES